MEIFDYVRPELLVVSIALYFLGQWIRQSELLAARFVPLVLGALGIGLCFMWVYSTSPGGGIRQTAEVVFASVTQGILVTGLSGYVGRCVQFYQHRRSDREADPPEADPPEDDRKKSG